MCGRCSARLAAHPRCEPGTLPRHEAKALYADVTAFDLAVDAWRAETEDDIDRLEWVALLVVEWHALKKEPVVAPSGKTSPPLDELIRRARRRISGARDHIAPGMRAAMNENEHQARETARLRRKQGWQEREDRIERLGFDLATRTA